MDYDLLVIGDERSGIEQALAAAERGDRTAVLPAGESRPSLDVLRLAAFNIADANEVSMPAWRHEVARLVRCQRLSEQRELDASGVDRIPGAVRFLTETEVEVDGPEQVQVIRGRRIVLACGTRSRLPGYLRGVDRFVTSVETFLNLPDLPRSVIVVGAGETGLNAAIMLATLGVEVTVVDEHATLLELCGLFEARFDAIQSLNIAFRLDDEVIGTELRPNLQAGARLASGRLLVADAILVCVGKDGNTLGLNLDAAGVGVDENGRIWCDDDGQTWSPQISATGDVVGFPRQSTVPPSHLLASAFAGGRLSMMAR